MSPQGELGDTASAYAVHSFAAGMARLAWIFQTHPELRGVQAVVDHAGHVDIVATAEPGVLHDWVHALPNARREQGLFSVHSGAAYEVVLIDGFLTVHVRPKPQQGMEVRSDEARMGLVTHGEQGLGASSPTGPPCTYCGIVGGHNGNCPVIS